jgi:hypothetical protein
MVCLALTRYTVARSVYSQELRATGYSKLCPLYSAVRAELYTVQL